jgi:hypothetical protein
MSRPFSATLPLVTGPSHQQSGTRSISIAPPIMNQETTDVNAKAGRMAGRRQAGSGEADYLRKGCRKTGVSSF